MKSHRGKKKSIFKNRNLIFPIILVLGGMLLIFNDMGIVKWYQLRQERRHIQTEIARLILEEEDLTIELDRLENDDEYINKIARERFHMVKPGEKVFRVLDRRKVKKDMMK
jgi:cell division protein FtsB